MSAIGDYIHYSYAGYVNKTGHQEEPYIDSAQSIISNRNRILNSWVEKQGKSKEAAALKTEIDKILQQLKEFKKTGNSRDVTEDLALYDNEMAQALAADMLRVLPEKYVRMDLVQAFALGTLNKAAYSSATSNIKGSGRDLQRAEYNQVKKQIEDFLNSYVKQIEDVINSSKTEVYKSDIKSYIDKIQNTTTLFLNKVGTLQHRNESYNKEFSIFQKEVKKIYKQLEQVFADSNANNVKELTSLCKTLANGLSAGIGASNSIGDLGEAIARLAGEKLGMILNEEIEDVKTLGADASHRGLNTSYFSSRVNVESLTNLKSKQKIGDFYLTSDSSKQDLVDVQIEFKTSDTMNLSIKTRKSSKNNAFKLHFEVANALELLQNENDENFINHFFNLNAIKGLENDSRREEINVLVRKLILAKMIAGYNRKTVQGNQLAADYFVIIDNIKFVSYVIPMRRLLQYIFEGSGQGALYNKVKIPVDLVSANTYIEGQHEMLIRINNVMKRLAVPTYATYNFNESIASSLK